MVNYMRTATVDLSDREKFVEFLTELYGTSIEKLLLEAFEEYFTDEFKQFINQQHS